MYICGANICLSYLNKNNWCLMAQYCLTIYIQYDRLLGAVVVIAANAGGAWTPIGDVTTTMLWIHGQISSLQTMKVILFGVVFT